ncbi:hypothetical protein [Nonomuraea sp. NEAU-A123]|uniref:hypothetical protein n=1 Tax=Nonomuraea sp. NEAU-A123 TaxID=2839649 RepID=UPI001BE45918|nr:hypothetical protein [Nonomuraea sp. NEAU-A123]MBT2226283.1 hypothetical protein [Nonomuraea sp. NEAU-A123]
MLIKATQPAIPTEVHDSPIYTAPGLSQEIVLATDRSALAREPFAWYLLWGSEFRGAGAGDLQRLTHGTDIDVAANIIKKVLHLNE